MSRSYRPSYVKLVQSLEARGQFRIKPGLDRIRAVLAQLGDPQNAVPVIHIAGTNGKGSVAATLESIHRAAGRRTGLYTSPHLTDLCERIQLDATPLAHSIFERLSALVLRAEMRAKISLTYFEFTTAVAFLAFREAKVDLLLLEVGLGGLWDATNVVERPLACIITSIGFDHTAWLGKTISKIATQKAGILKYGVPAFTSAQGPALHAIERVATRQHAPLTVVGRDVRVLSAASATPAHDGRFVLKSSMVQKAWPCVLWGRHQLENAALAVTCAESVHAVPVSADSIRLGLSRVQWPGRLQRIRSGETSFLLDGAHNPAAARSFALAIQEFKFNNASNVLLFSAYSDKDYAAMLRILRPVATRIVVTVLPTARAASLAELTREAKKHFKEVISAPLLRNALQTAQRLAGTGEVLVTGSLALVGDLLKELKANPLSPIAFAAPSARPRKSRARELRSRVKPGKKTRVFQGMIHA